MVMQHGLHLLLDGISRHLLTSLEIHSFLSECPRVLGLKIFFGPAVYPMESGFQGIVLVAESHCSVRTVGLETYCDIFSCRPFATEPVMELAHELLFLDRKSKPRQQVLRRGWGQPD